MSRRTEQKITNVHGITPDEVREAVVCRSGLRFSWDDDEERGLRAIIEVEIQSRPALIVVYPVGDDVFDLGSAYFTDR